MPCIKLIQPGKDPKRGRHVGFLCVGHEPVEVAGQLFEWTAASGWCAVNRDGSQRMTPVPNHAWAALETAEQNGQITRPGTAKARGRIMPCRHKTGTRQWSQSSVNIQTGCENNCAYCYAREMAVRHKRVTAGEWTNPTPRLNAVQKGYGKRQGVVMFPTTHDITPENLDECVHVLQKLLRAGNPVLIVSKPRLVCVERMVKDLAEWREQIMFRFSITTLWPKVHKLWEPNAPDPQERTNSAALAMDAGYRVSISVEPFLGGLEKNWSVADMAVQHYKVAGRVSDGPIWFGLMNEITRRVLPSVPAEEVERLKAMRQPEAVRQIYDALTGNPRVKFKESITNTLGLPADEDEWLAGQERTEETEGTP